MTPDISFIVSAYNRPDHLLCCLSSLHVQTHNNIEIIVTDNATDLTLAAENREVCTRWNDRYLKTSGPTCYHSAEVGADNATGRFLCFPSDDSYYVPEFAAKMLQAADQQRADLVYCEMVYNPHIGSPHYALLGVQPRLNRIDKTGFILRRELFKEFPGKPEDSAPCAADGYLIDRLVAGGVRHVKVPDILAVHN